MENISDRVIEKNQNTHFMLNNFFPRKSYLLWDNMEKYFTAGQATDDNMTHALCMLDTYVYKHTLRIYNKVYILILGNEVA